MKSDRKVVAAGLGNVIHNYEERYCKLRIRSIILRDSYYFPFTYAAETWTTTPPPKKRMKEDLVSSKGKSFAEYLVRYAREGSGG